MVNKKENRPERDNAFMARYIKEQLPYRYLKGPFPRLFTEKKDAESVLQGIFQKLTISAENGKWVINELVDLGAEPLYKN